MTDNKETEEKDRIKMNFDAMNLEGQEKKTMDTSHVNSNETD